MLIEHVCEGYVYPYAYGLTIASVLPFQGVLIGRRGWIRVYNFF